MPANSCAAKENRYAKEKTLKYTQICLGA